MKICAAQRIVATALALVALAPCAAPAADPSQWHYGLLGGYVRPDAVRDAASAYDVLGLAGWEFDDGLALELNAFAQQTTRASDSGKEQSYGGGVDLALGRAVPGNLLFLLGAGALSEDPGGAGKVTSAYGSAGLGAYLPFSWSGERWRLEARYNAVFNHRTYPGQDTVEDLRLNLGVVWGGRGAEAKHEPLLAGAAMDSDMDGVPDTKDQCPETQVGAKVDVKGCPEQIDADSDGVPDEFDRCPHTPRWVRPDASGCTPDDDGDGVDNAHDACPGTPTGAQVDERGCVIPPPPGPDEDHDGVPDSQDRCAGTPAGYAVDEQGCVRAEEILTRRVYFDIASSRLTADGYQLLHAVAAQLLRQPQLRVEIAGHADVTGTRPYNRRLAERRAAVVRDFLVAAGVPRAQMLQHGYGDTRPATENTTDEGRAGNRRVEFQKIQIEPLEHDR